MWTINKIYMKTVRLFCSIVSFGALMLGVSLADEPSASTSQSPATSDNHTQTTAASPSSEAQGTSPHDKSDQVSTEKPAPKQPEAQSTSRNRAAPPPQIPGQTAGAVKNDLAPSKSIWQNARPVSSAIPKPNITPQLSAVRNRGTSPTTIGGSMTPPSIKSTTAAINGTGMKRKPQSPNSSPTR